MISDLRRLALFTVYPRLRVHAHSACASDLLWSHALMNTPLDLDGIDVHLGRCRRPAKILATSSHKPSVTSFFACIGLARHGVITQNL